MANNLIVERLVDAGYLSWVFGPRPELITAWQNHKSKYNLRSGSLLLMDAPNNVRKDFYPPYKAHREERRADDPEKQKRKEMVDFFRDELLLNDPTNRVLAAEGLEADDWVGIAACSSLFPNNRPITLIGVDKDLLQIPQSRLLIERHTGDPVRLWNFIEKQAKAMQLFMKYNWHILLTLAILGDKSDNIPRLLPPRDFTPIGKIYKSATPFTDALDRFGDEFKRNLYLTFIPWPGCFLPVITQDELPLILDDLVRHQTWTHDNWGYYIQDDYLGLLENSMKPMGIGEMFDKTNSVHISTRPSIFDKSGFQFEYFKGNAAGLIADYVSNHFEGEETSDD